MKTLLHVLTAAFVLAAPVSAAMADEHGADHSAPAMEAPAMEAPAMEAEAAAPAILTYTLEDGTSVVVEDAHVFVLDKDGNRTAAPDGDHKTVDGATLTVKEGKLAAEATTEAPAEGAAE